jgi:hypothetical protein
MGQDQISVLKILRKQARPGNRANKSLQHPESSLCAKSVPIFPAGPRRRQAITSLAAAEAQRYWRSLLTELPICLVGHFPGVLRERNEELCRLQSDCLG